MGAVRTMALGGLRHRRLQGAIVAGVLLLGTLATTLALGVLIGSHAPFQRAFDAANGAHLVVSFDGSYVDPAAAAATAAASGVTAASGPWQVGLAGVLANAGDVAKGGFPFYFPVAISARPDPNTAVDRVTVFDGRWWRQPGEVVISRAQANRSGKGVGDSIDLRQVVGPDGTLVPPGTTASGGARASEPVTKRLTIVGVAASISTPDVAAWLSTEDLEALMAGSTPDIQMLYRVDPAATSADLATALRAIEAKVPSRTTGSVSTWLALAERGNLTANLMVPILLAFGAFAFLAAAFIVVNVVSGVVIGSQRQIGLMQAVGYTPRLVTLVLLGQILVPAAIGAVVGTVAGALISQPILDQTAAALSVPTVMSVPPEVLVAVPFAAFSVALLAAIWPAWRAGRGGAARAIQHGTTASDGRFAGIARTAFLRPGLPATTRLGLGHLLARPGRATMTLGALVVGVAAVTFTFGMETSLRNVGGALFRDQASPVRAELRTGPGPAGRKPPTADPAAITAAIAGLPGVARFVPIGIADVTVSGLASTIPFVAYQGESTWLGYQVIEGHWFNGPGEVVAPENLLARLGLHVGDRLTMQVEGWPVDVTIVGSIFDDARENRDNLVLRGGWDTLAGVDPTLQASRWEVANDGNLISPASLVARIREVTNNAVDAQVAQSGDADEGFLFFEGVIAMLGLVLVLIAIGGVVNTVLLDARARARETAVLRAVGMTPRQVAAMAVASVAPLGVLAALIGIPVGLALQRAVIVDMGRIAISSSVPASLTNVATPLAVIGIAAAGVGIAVVGSWLPSLRTARWAIAPVLQAE